MNFVATQYIAARFQYQAGLGAPILRAKSGGIYQPFSWIAWGWRYCTSQDERIRRPFFEGEMIVFAGSFLCIGNLLRPRKPASTQNLRRMPKICMAPPDGLTKTTFATPDY